MSAVDPARSAETMAQAEIEHGVRYAETSMSLGNGGYLALAPRTLSAIAAVMSSPKWRDSQAGLGPAIHA
jgi:hypothetical protein